MHNAHARYMLNVHVIGACVFFEKVDRPNVQQFGKRMYLCV